MKDLSFLEQISMAVQDPGGADAELLRDVAAEYAEAVVAVNERLMQVGVLLNKGLRGEALQAADRSPKVLDLVTKLDFPELESWNQMLFELELPSAPRLKLDLAQDIDAAYDEHSGLEELLKKHRLLALARGSLTMRLRVLRLIQKKDSLNPVWLQDLEAWERTRLTQIAGEIPRLLKNSNRDGLIALVDELDEQWIIPAAADAKARGRKAAEQVQAIWARGEMVKVASRLNSALVALDVSAGQASRSEWEHLSAMAMLKPDDPLASKAAEAIEWLNGEDDFQAEESAYAEALIRLEKTLERKVTSQELNQRVYDAQKFQREMPEALESRTARKRAELESGRKRKTMALVAVAVLAMILIGAAVTMAIQQRGRNLQIADGMKRLDSLNEQQDYAAAEKLHESLPEYVRNHADVIKLWTKIDSESSALKTRKAQFRSLMDEAKTAGMDNPRMELLEQARGFASSPAEQEEVKLYERSVEQRQNTLMSERSAAFRARMDAATQGLRQLEIGGIDDQEMDVVIALGTELDRLRSEYSGFVAKWPLVSVDLLKQVDPLRNRISGHVKNLEAQRAQFTAFQTVTESVGDWGSFLKSLKSAASVAINPAQKTELELTSREAELWQGLVAWQDLSSEQFWNALPNMKANQAKSILIRMDELEQKHPGFWLAGQTTAAREFLTEMANLAPDGHEQAKDRLKSTFSSRTMRRIYMVQEDDAGTQNRYYCELEPKLGEQSVAFDYLIDMQMLDTARKAVTSTSGKLMYHGLAPQARIAEKLLKRLDGEGESFEELCLDLIEIVLNDEPAKNQVSADPVIRVLMLKYILAEAVTSSPSHGKLLAQFQHAVEETFVSRLDWIDPNNKDTKIRRQDCSDLLKRRTESISNLRLTWENRRSQINSLANFRKQADMGWVGWMHQDAQGDWKLSLKTEPAAGFSFFVLMADNGNPRVVQFHEAGKYADSNLQVTSGSRFQSGRPVFCLQDDVGKFISGNVSIEYSR